MRVATKGTERERKKERERERERERNGGDGTRAKKTADKGEGEVTWIGRRGCDIESSANRFKSLVGAHHLKARHVGRKSRRSLLHVRTVGRPRRFSASPSHNQFSFQIICPSLFQGFPSTPKDFSSVMATSYRKCIRYTVSVSHLPFS